MPTKSGGNPSERDWADLAAEFAGIVVQRGCTQGTLVRDLQSGGASTEPIDLQLSFSDMLGAPPRATGTFGSLQPGGRNLPAAPTAQRCSLPREGCGPLVSGDAPCTVWPPCP